ncbi:hypothetical protein ACIBQ6_40775 [Nonomuraea sp. NPDC049655]|uniref:hypothetical protein n=1 Tax=Nonomuraea sp. NPDC049655 TaxID=3364355 RepID=UPI0037A0834C
MSNLLRRGRCTEETLSVFLRACGITGTEQAEWRAARERALTDRPPQLGMMRVAQTLPRRLGVHAAIDISGANDDLPAYVPRDTDTAPGGIRALLQTAVARGGLVLLVGGSSVGKTRCAFEAIQALMPQWWLLHPASAAGIRTLATEPVARTVVWLDELQRYLGGADGLSAETVRALLHNGAVIVATLWPEIYSTYTAPPADDAIDPHGRERELLKLADVVHISSNFSETERERAGRLADADPRVRLALQSSDYGFTQTMAAAPQLVARWLNANPYEHAILSAAVDAFRLGVHGPMHPEFLRTTAPAYCDARSRGAAPPDWFASALAGTTALLHGATSCLAPVAQSMGEVTGYVLADYLKQRIFEERRSTSVPAEVWHALAIFLTEPDDLARAGDGARKRMMYGIAERLYRRAMDAGVFHAGLRLSELLIAQGRAEEGLDIVRGMATSGDIDSMLQLARMLEKAGQVGEAAAVLRAVADQGENIAALRLIVLLSQHERWEEAGAELASRAAKRAWPEASDLAEMIVQLNDMPETPLQVEIGDWHATPRLAELLVEQGRIDEGLDLLRARDAIGDLTAAARLTELQAQYRPDDLRLVAETGYSWAASRWAQLLLEQGRIDELRALASSGDEYAQGCLCDFLINAGRIDELRMLAGRGNAPAAMKLATWLEWQGNLEEAATVLFTRLKAGDAPHVFIADTMAHHWVDLLEALGKTELAEHLRRSGISLEDRNQSS